MRGYADVFRIFSDRTEAAEELAEQLIELKWNQGPSRPDLVLGLARGGVPIAKIVAERLGTDWDVLVLRKIGAPNEPELGVGAICEDGVPLFSKGTLRWLGLQPEDLAPAVAAKQAELMRRLLLYRGKDHQLADVSNRNICVVDDGLATGVTAEAAAHYLRRRGVRILTLGVPVAAPDTARTLKQKGKLYDQVVSLQSPESFGSVGSWYQNFEPVDDTHVIAALASRTQRAGLQKAS